MRRSECIKQAETRALLDQQPVELWSRAVTQIRHSPRDWLMRRTFNETDVLRGFAHAEFRRAGYRFEGHAGS